MTDITRFGFASDIEFATHLIEKIGIAAVPGSSFYAHSGEGDRKIRFCFCKKYETLELARNQLQKLL